ncbi:MAG: hypothetical protein CM15mP18_3780 [Methanobacteriota archaeon]|nr:MAG: hypothetical protein CM15mP18_3780 [Euryarchaeota archaeon]
MLGGAVGALILHATFPVGRWWGLYWRRFEGIPQSWKHG